MTRRRRKALPVTIVAAALLAILPHTIKSGEPSEPDLNDYKGPGKPHQFDSFVVVPANAYAGETSHYVLELLLAHPDFVHLRRGGLAFEFPAGFDLQAITQVDIADTGGCFDYAVRRVQTSGQRVKIYLMRDKSRASTCRGDDGDSDDDDADGHDDDDSKFVRVTVSLDSIGNPIAAGPYTIDGWAFDRRNRVLVGPTASAPFQIVGGPTLKVVDVSVLSPNAPRVNTGQPFQIMAHVANLSDDVGSVELELSSDGGSTFDPDTAIGPIPAGDTIDAVFDVTAGPGPDPTELFRVDITEPVQPPQTRDNIVAVIIERPADLELFYELIGVDNGTVGAGETFALAVVLTNRGDAAASAGEYTLVTFGFPDDDSLVGPITVGEPLTFSFDAPPFDTTLQIRFSITGIPLDSNTAEPAMLRDTSIEFSVSVQTQVGDLLAEATPVGGHLAVPRQSRQLFELALTNLESPTGAAIRLRSLDLVFTDSDDALTDPRNIVDITRARFIDESGAIVATAEPVHLMGRLTMRFEDFVIAPGVSQPVFFETRFQLQLPDEFALTLFSEDIDGVFAEGPDAGVPVDIVSPAGDLVFFQRYTKHVGTLEGSFVIENNPYRPGEGPARFAYTLDRPSAVEFRLFTVTGEEVYSMTIPEGQVGTAAGDNELLWQGRNDNGDLVMSGVYVAIIRVLKTNQRASMKVAVVR